MLIEERRIAYSKQWHNPGRGAPAMAPWREQRIEWAASEWAPVWSGSSKRREQKGCRLEKAALVAPAISIFSIFSISISISISIATVSACF
jgi:hypothetical protein